MHRIIRELGPRWVVIENVAALKNNGADTVLGDMEEIGYACWPVVVPAWAVGAPHNRERVWIVGYAKHNGSPSTEVTRLYEEAVLRGAQGATSSMQPEGTGSSGAISGEAVADTDSPRQYSPSGSGEIRRRSEDRSDERGEPVADSEREGSQRWLQGWPDTQWQGLDGHAGRGGTGLRTRWPAPRGVEQYEWEAPRLTEPEMGSTVDGLSRKLVLEALGNAVVPQIPEAIADVLQVMDSILTHDKTNR